MIKKILATTLATLSVASMSLPAMAVETPAQTKETLDFEIIDKSSIKYDPINFIEEAVDVNDKDIMQPYEEKDAGNGFTILEANADQKQALKDADKSLGYIAIRNNVKALKQHASNTCYAASQFNASGTASGAWNTIKDVGYIVGDTACYPISGGLRYAHKNGLLTKAKDKIVSYVKEDLKNKALDYVGLGKKDNKKDSKVAKAFKWGKNVFNFFAK